MLGEWTARSSKLQTNTVNGSPGKGSMTPGPSTIIYYEPFTSGFTESNAPKRCCDANHRLGHGGHRDPLTRRIFRDDTFARNCPRFRLAEFCSCGSCCDAPLEAILRSCLEDGTPISATDGA